MCLLRLSGRLDTLQLIGFAVMATGEMQCCWESNEHCSLYHTLCLVAQLCLVRPWSDIM